MNSQLLDCGKVHILADENKDLAVFSFVKNPEYVYDSEPNSIPPEWPPKIVPLFYSKTAFELKNPYTIEELAAIIKKGIGAWDTLEPYISRKKSIEEFYYKIDGFKKATFGKKLLVVDMESNGKKRISISLPVKAGKYYLGIEQVFLSAEANWMDIAEVVNEFLEMDITKVSAYKTFKRKLNI